MGEKRVWFVTGADAHRDLSSPLAHDDAVEVN